MPWDNHIYAFFYKQHFYKQRQAEIGKKKPAKANQHPEAKLSLFEIYSLSSSRYHTKMSGDILKNVQKISLSVLMTLYD